MPGTEDTAVNKTKSLSERAYILIKKKKYNKQTEYRTEIEINQVSGIECNGKGKEECCFNYEGQ